MLLSTKDLKLKEPSRKLSLKFVGPFRVVEPVGAQAYRLLLLANKRIHPIFYVLRLEKYVRHNGAGDPPFLSLLDIVKDKEE